MVMVNLVNPGKGINKELVDDARREGTREIERAAEATKMVRRVVTWNFETHNSRTPDGRSDRLNVESDRPQVLLLRLAQKEKATTPASVEVFWRTKEEEELKPLSWKVGQQELKVFAAGLEEDVYDQKVPLPSDAFEIQLDYVAQQGGRFSVLTAEVSDGPPTIGMIFKNLLLMLFTDNLLGSMTEVNLLPLIVFSIVFAAMLTTMGKRSEVIANLVLSINDALLSFILLLMKLAPLGIFCLVASRFGKAQAEGNFVQLLMTQAKYIATVLLGLGFHALVTLPALLYVFTRRNPFRFIGQMSQAILTAFSTASSTATLPVTMECAEMRAGVSRRSTEFVLPLGATINMDGTALYEAAAAIFIAQAYAVIDPAFQLGFTEQAVIAVTATLAAIGAAGIPEAGLVTLLIVLNAVNLPLALIGLVLPVDWLLDRFRTAVNAFGDSVGAAIVDRSFDKTEAHDA